MYPDIKLFIDGEWTEGTSGKSEAIVNPTTGKVLARLAHAGAQDLDQALHAVDKGFKTWRRVSAFDRSKLLRKAGELIRSRADAIAELMTLEQGKPLGEARMEATLAGDTMDWFAEEARRSYGQVVPARADGVLQLVVKEPVGPVAAFTPWNFPINQAVRKVSAALAAGCSVILKGPEETPASCAALVQAFVDAGLPPGVLNLVFGVPAEISEHLIASPIIRKITFTGSTPVGKKLAALAGQQMKRITMELGGHAPAIVFGDADVDAASSNWPPRSSATPGRSASRRPASWCMNRSTSASSPASSRRRKKSRSATARIRRRGWARSPTPAGSRRCNCSSTTRPPRVPSC